MRKKPKLAYLVGGGFLFLALGFPTQVALYYGHAFSEWNFVLEKLSPFNWAVMLLSLVNAALAWKMSSALKWGVPLQMLFVAWNNGIVGLSGLNSSLLVTQSATLAFVAACSVFLLEPYRGVIQNPNRRWWRTAARVRTSLPLLAHSPLGLSLKAHCYDLSEGGLFVRLAEDLVGSSAEGALEPGRVLDIRLQVNHVQVLNLRAKIVRSVRAPRGFYPAGLGLQFLSLSPYQKKLLSQLVDRKMTMLETEAA